MTHKARDFVYSDKVQTDIFLEEPTAENPYIAQSSYIHGYNVLELAQQTSFSAALLTLFRGELPTIRQERMLSTLLIGLMNLGPRHPAVKAAMVAGVSKTNAEHLLPIGLSVAGGKQNGAGEVFDAMVFIRESQGQAVTELVEKLLNDRAVRGEQGEIHLAPGFGDHYGGIDEFCAQLSLLVKDACEELSDFPALAWAFELASELNKQGYGWLKTGLVAAVFCELGISARQGIGLFQLICAPGIFAQGVEQMHKPITAIPMPADEQHIYQQRDHQGQEA